jgi:hypothetical protein
MHYAHNEMVLEVHRHCVLVAPCSAGNRSVEA